MQRKSEEIPETLYPYLNKVTTPKDHARTKFDYLHEREWRVPRDIILTEVRPIGVEFEHKMQGVPHEAEMWELILSMLQANKSEREELDSEDMTTIRSSD